MTNTNPLGFKKKQLLDLRNTLKILNDFRLAVEIFRSENFVTGEVWECAIKFIKKRFLSERNYTPFKIISKL